VLGTQLRVQNKVYKVDPSTDLEMCKAIVRSTPRPLFACPQHPCCVKTVELALAATLPTFHSYCILGVIFFWLILDWTFAARPVCLCAPQIREMHTELLKHKMKEDGEDNIYDTAGMAICLGVVQNYTFEQDTARKVWKLIRKENPDEDALFGGFAGANGDEEASARMVEGLLLTKKACMDFAEELQLEISEVCIAPARILPSATILPKHP
jgi:hypothetical protein